MEWVNGSIVETAVSTGARSFNWGTSYGQSLVADILEDGASGSQGVCVRTLPDSSIISKRSSVLIF
jgi:hypothetical protein